MVEIAINIETKGLIFGEEHGNSNLRQFLIAQLKNLRTNNFSTLLLEFGKSEQDNENLSRFVNNQLSADELTESLIPIENSRAYIPELFNNAKDLGFSFVLFNADEPNREERMNEIIRSQIDVCNDRYVILAGAAHSIIRTEPNKEYWRTLAELLCEQTGREAIINILSCCTTRPRFGGMFREKPKGLIESSRWKQFLKHEDIGLHPLGKVKVGDGCKFGGGYPMTEIISTETMWDYVFCHE